MNDYQVIVSNLGAVHTGHNRRLAMREFIAWCAESSESTGRASHESVTLLCDGEPIRESCGYNVELTDTFGGEANYSWCRRYALTLPQDSSDVQVMRAAKRACGLSGMPGVSSNYGDSLEFRPYRQCVVMFATYDQG